MQEEEEAFRNTHLRTARSFLNSLVVVVLFHFFLISLHAIYFSHSIFHTHLFVALRCVVNVLQAKVPLDGVHPAQRPVIETEGGREGGTKTRYR